MRYRPSYRADTVFRIILLEIDRVTNRPRDATLIKPKSTVRINTDGLAGTADGISILTPRVTSSKPVRRRPKKKFMILNSADEFDDDDEGAISAPRAPKSAADVASISAAISNNFLFQNIGGSQRQEVIDMMIKVPVRAGEVIIQQGDKGDRFYIVDSGRYEVRMLADPEGPPAQDDHRPTNAKYGQFGLWRHEYTTANNAHPCFGELSLMYGKPRGATVIALQDGVLWALDRADFKKLLLKAMGSRRRLLDNLRRVKILRCLDVSAIQRLADILNETTFKKGEVIIRQGTPGDNFYMIIEGKCHVTIASADKASSADAFVNRLDEWDYFGERALLSNEMHSSSVTATTDVKAVYINKRSFDEIFGSLAELIDKDRRLREDLARLEVQAPRSIKELSLEAVVSQGETFSLLLGRFGDIQLSSQSFVLSKVSKAGEAKTINTALEVTRLLRTATAQQSFLPHIVTALREGNAVHLLYKTPVVGDLSSLIKKDSEGFSEETVSYIGGCVVTALGALHKAGIISRGVQPENLYLDTEGRVVLFDHRTCKVGVAGEDVLSYTLCGTTDYLSPEQVSMSGHGRAVDFWALGVLLFELTTGTNPFAMGGEVATFNKISSLGSSAFLKVQVPASVFPTVKTVVQKLLLPNPSSRLGMGPGGIAAIRGEQLFKDLNWNTMYLDASPLRPFALQMQKDIVSDGVSNIADTEGWDDPLDGVKLNFEIDVSME